MRVVPKNENKIDEVTSILRELQQQYVPLHNSDKPIGIALGGDQLTAERALGIPLATLHHTTQSSEKDEKVIIDQLMKKSLVFDLCQEDLIIHSPICRLAWQKPLMQTN